MILFWYQCKSEDINKTPTILSQSVGFFQVNILDFFKNCTMYWVVYSQNWQLEPACPRLSWNCPFPRPVYSQCSFFLMCPQLLHINHSDSCHIRPEETPCYQVLYVLCNTEVWWMCWPWSCAVSEAVPVEVSCFKTHGDLRLRGWPWSASCYCTKYSLEEKERLNLHLCLPLISQFATL